MFKIKSKKQKTNKSPQEIEAEREARLAEASDKMQTQLYKIEKMKKTYVQKAAEAEQKGLDQQKQTAIAQLRNCMKLEKQINGMMMNLELAIQAKELTSLTAAFMQCMSEISLGITEDNKNTDIKKTQDQFMRAMYSQQQQEEKLNEMLDTGNYTLVNGMQASDEISEFDDEIDAMIADASKSMGSSAYNSDSYRNKR